jgi:hypothetical protein
MIGEAMIEATAILDPVGDRQRSPATGVSAWQATGGGRR